MMNNEEMLKKIDEVSGNFEGDLELLYLAVGRFVVGQLYGWRVIRLTTSTAQWTRACKLFGDFKDLMPERGKYAKKSIGLRIVDKVGDYWEVVKGHIAVPMADRKKVV